jgi:dynein heavy chain
MRVTRAINLKRSNCMLVGVGGSGKQSITRLAGYIGRHAYVHQITLTKSYSNKDFLEDMKKCWMDGSRADIRNVSFLMTDAEIKSEDFLE